MLQSPMEVAGRRFEVEYVSEKRKTVAAYFYPDRVVIKMPLSLRQGSRTHVLDSLERRILRHLEKLSARGFEALDKEKLPQFQNGQQVTVLGRAFDITIIEKQSAKRPKAVLRNGTLIDVTLPASLQGQPAAEIVSDLVRRVLSKCMLPDLRARLDAINSRYYGFSYNMLRIKKQSRLWGSTSYPEGNININYRLLFAPEPMLEYVMAHELSHLKVRNHSKSFWMLVERAVPDHKQRRRWLRQNGSRLGIGIQNENVSYAAAPPLQQAQAP